jgi:hypothetical protein
MIFAFNAGEHWEILRLQLLQLLFMFADHH